MISQMDIDEIRRINLKELEKEFGPELYKKAGMSPTQFYNLRDGAKDSKTGKPRGMRKQTAWKLEDAAEKPRGYLDKLHGKENLDNPLKNLNLSTLDIDLLGVFQQIIDPIKKGEVVGFAKNTLEKQKNMRNLLSTTKTRRVANSK